MSDFDRTNNTLMADLSAIAVNLSLAVAADKPAYTELEQAIFTASVSNAGSFARQVQVRLSVLDAGGQLVQVLPLGAPVNVAAGASAPSAGLWPVAGVLSGNYQVKAELITTQGVVYGAATASFVVNASQQVANLSLIHI